MQRGEFHPGHDHPTDQPIDRGASAHRTSPARCWTVCTHHVHTLEMNGESYRLNRHTDNPALSFETNKTLPKHTS